MKAEDPTDEGASPETEGELPTLARQLTPQARQEGIFQPHAAVDLSIAAF